MKTRPDRHIRPLVAALLMGMAPHIMDLPLWINLWCLGIWSGILLIDVKKWFLPPRWLWLILVVIAFTAIIASARGRFDSDSGIGLLCLMASLKPFEIKGHRDRMITLFLAYFMVIASLFFSSSLGMTVYLFVAVLVITGLLIRVNHPDMGLSPGLRLSIIIVAQAIPLALILFTVFPRIQGSLWGVQQKKTVLTGLSSTLYPGSMTNLVANKAVAFRVSFDSKIPGSSELYWRGMVFQMFDGKGWRLDPDPALASQLPPGESPVRYEVILEPHNERWMFVLDLPATFPVGYDLMADYTLMAKEKIIAKKRYGFVSNMVHTAGDPEHWDNRSVLLPLKGNPLAQALARSLQGEKATPQTIVDGVLSMIHNQEFYYSLDPPLLGKDPVDDFLFNTRSGYCEHYASAFVFLMRAAGVPARIVSGYLGGEVNPYGNYVIVRQSQAHAWAEVWMENRGWIRVDPTAAIARERVETGTLQLGLGNMDQNLVDEGDGGFFKGLGKNVQLGWDALNFLWYSKVVGYTAQSQKRFLERFGLSLSTLGDWIKIMGLATLLMGCLTALFYLGLSLKHRHKIDPVVKNYLIFLKKMGKIGIQRLPHEGPQDFAETASCKRKDLRPDISGITRLYILLRYAGKNMDKNLLRDFKDLVKRFRP
ncbi:MAG: DUF3488 and transglutaminase-like domain-containing protein [Proteobacteria bacterium]|nr:DUF3488 and transglutaminase-like domain-containing protein [Pseudomonadota bacterium]